MQPYNCQGIIITQTHYCVVVFTVNAKQKCVQLNFSISMKNI